jgi:hypothetical protein
VHLPPRKPLQEDDIQKLHTSVPDQLTDQELLLSTISAADLDRKHSGGWDKEHPKCLFCGKAYRFRTFTVQCHMTSQVTVSGKHKSESTVCCKESTKDDSLLKARFFAVRKEIYNHYKEKQQTERQPASATLKRVMSERERQSELIKIDEDITAPGASKQTNRTVMDKLIKKPSHEDFVAVWSEEVFGKGLTFDFFSDTLVRKAILVTAQCADSIITSSSTHGKDTVLPRRTTWTSKILPATDDRQQEAIRVLTPLYKEIGSCFMGDEWQSTSNRPIINIQAASDGLINVRRAFDASGKDKKMPFISNSMVAEMHKTFMQDVMDEQGQVLFDNLTWFAKKMCSVMTGASACEHMWSIEGWIHNKRRNRLAQPNIEWTVCVHDNLVLRKAILLSKEWKVAWDSQTRICEPDRRTNAQGVDDVDDDDTDSDTSNACQDHHRLSE